MVNALQRIVLVGRDIELRIVSLVVRCREMADEIILFDTGSNDETVELAQEVDCFVHHCDDVSAPQRLCAELQNIDAVDGTTMFLPITGNWKLSQLPLSFNRSRDGWDIHYLFLPTTAEKTELDETVIADTTVGHLIVSETGCNHLASLAPSATPASIDSSMRVRFVMGDAPVTLPQRESLATASRFAQLFYWMLESKHPLLLFGIPGVVLFVLGYRLSGDLATMFTELNSTSIGVTLVTIAMTLTGLFAMMVALILYIMGKQVARIQHQYDWPKAQ